MPHKGHFFCSILLFFFFTLFLSAIFCVEFVKRHNPLGNEPFDIEDLVNIGRTKGP